ATYTTQYLLTIRIVGSGTVTASPTSPDGYYPAGSSVQLTAAPGAGQALRYWLRDIRGKNLTTPLPTHQQRLVTANINTTIPLRVLNGASFISVPQFDLIGAGVTPFELVSIFGTGIGPATGTFGQIASGRVTTSLAGTQVMFDTTPAPITYAGPDQINVVVPG